MESPKHNLTEILFHVVDVTVVVYITCFIRVVLSFVNAVTLLTMNMLIIPLTNAHSVNGAPDALTISLFGSTVAMSQFNTDSRLIPIKFQLNNSSKKHQNTPPYTHSHPAMSNQCSHKSITYSMSDMSMYNLSYV